MELIRIEKINELYVKLRCEPWMAKEIDSFFTFKVPGYQFTPAYRSGMWNGEIHLFNTSTCLLYAGLTEYIEKFALEREYKVEYLYDNAAFEFSLVDAKQEIQSYGIKIEPRDYQIEAFAHAVRNHRAMMLSPTASGKSLIIYLLIRWYRFFRNKVLLIVPTTSLVQQMHSDFQSYGFDSEKYCHMIYSGKEKETNQPIVITTWQSVYKMPKAWFNKFDVVIGDEAHLFKAKSLTKILSNLDQCKYRFGFTGTLDGTQTHRLVLEGLFGPVKKVTTTKELMDQKHLSSFKIKCLVLKYSDEECKSVSKMKYQDEIDFIVSSQKRNNFIKKLALSLNGNTLLLFQYIEKHGKILYDLISSSVESGRQVYFVHGGIGASDREDIRRLVEMEKDAIIIASYGTFSTGINIRNLHNIIFASPSKSRIRNLQSIGRGLRLGENKDGCVLFDLADDLTWKAKKNYSLDHFVERMKIYNEEKFESKIYSIGLT
jgi:superfamily II DNA or RNA helicase